MIQSKKVLLILFDPTPSLTLFRRPSITAAPSIPPPEVAIMLRSRLLCPALLALSCGCNLPEPSAPSQIAQVPGNHFDLQTGQVSKSPASLKQADQATC